MSPTAPRKKAYSSALAAVVGQDAATDRETALEEIAEATRTPQDPAPHTPRKPKAAPEQQTPPAPVQRKRTERMVPFATRIPLDLQDEVKAYCEETGELITDFTTQAMRYLLDYRRRQ